MRKAFVLLIILAVLVALTGCWFWETMDSGTTQPLHGVWGVNPSDVFAVGGLESPIILHYDGSSWSEMTLPEEIPGTIVFTDVWGTGPNDVFAVGTLEPGRLGFVCHWDGTSWEIMDGEHPKLLRGVWGTAPDNVWAVGGAEDVGGVIEHYDGSEWEVVYSFDWEGWGLSAVWGTAYDNVFAVGDKGTVFYYDGNDSFFWTFECPSPTTVDLLDVHGHSPTEVYAVGQDGTIMRYNGSTWSQVDSGTTRTLFGVTTHWAVGEGGVLLMYSGGEWGPWFTPTTEHLFDVWRYSATGYAVAVGWNGTIVDFPHAPPGSESASMGIELESSALLSSNSILSADTATLGDHVAITVEVEVTEPPLTVEDSLPDELSYIPGTLEVVSEDLPATCTTSEHEIVCVLESAGSYVITFDVQVTRASGYVGAGVWYQPQDLEGEDIVVENTVTIGSETTTETLTITPFEGFYKLYSKAWRYEEGTLVYLADPLDVPTNTDVHWDIYLVVYNSPGDAISEMAGVTIRDRLGNELELDETVMIIWDGSSTSYDYTDPAKLSGKTEVVKLSWTDVPPLADGDLVAPYLEISTDVDPKTGQQEFADDVVTEHELNSGAVLKFTDPETGLHLRADIPPIVVTADPNWGEE